MERAAGTIQDRLVTDLRLAGAVNIAEANEVLNGLLPRFNERFGVQAEQDCPAYRFLEQSVALDGIYASNIKHRRKASRDNTVEYNGITLQLLPGVTRPTFAGVQVKVQEDLVGQLLVQYQGQTIPSQEASPRPAQLRETAATPPGSSGLDRGINGAGVQRDSHLATLKTGEVEQDPRPRKSRVQQHKMPTARIGLCGRMCSRPSSRDSPSGRSPANWASTGTS